MSPRIYVYKITFEEAPFYYFGSKKEKILGEEYFGSPKTNRWYWNTYTPKKQILETFDYTDEGYKKCREIECRLIKYFINDPLCLNAGCFGYYKPRPFTDERRKRISRALKGRRLPEKTRIEFSKNRMGPKNGMFGKSHSEETKVKIANKAHGRRHSEESKKKISQAFRGNNHPLYGVGHSEEAKKKMSESKKGVYNGRNNPNCKIRSWKHEVYGVCENLAIFELAEKFNFLLLNRSKLSSVANGRLKSHKGWSLIE